MSNPSSDTLGLDGFRRDRELPLAQIEEVNHPDAVAAARARIAELPETFPVESAADLPVLPGDKLVTDREKLRKTLTEPALSNKKRRVLPSIMQPVLTAVGVFLLILIVFKSPVIISQLGWNAHKTPSQATQASTVISASPTITIPKINVQAPVVYEPSTDETTFEHALESGVVHYGSTAVPGQVGNVAIFGHSSNDWWQPGNYKFVFVLLDKLVPGDKVMIDYNSVRYTYEVTGSTVVEPTNVGVLNQTPTPTLSLITCTPPGTSWKRLVVTAKQVDPDPSGARVKPVVASQSNSSLSSGSPSFWQQIKDSFGSLIHGGKNKPKASPTPAPGSLPNAS